MRLTLAIHAGTCHEEDGGDSGESVTEHCGNNVRRWRCWSAVRFCGGDRTGFAVDL